MNIHPILLYHTSARQHYASPRRAYLDTRLCAVHLVGRILR